MCLPIVIQAVTRRIPSSSSSSLSLSISHSHHFCSLSFRPLALAKPRVWVGLKPVTSATRLLPAGFRAPSPWEEKASSWNQTKTTKTPLSFPPPPLSVFVLCQSHMLAWVWGFPKHSRSLLYVYASAEKSCLVHLCNVTS